MPVTKVWGGEVGTQFIFPHKISYSQYAISQYASSRADIFGADWEGLLYSSHVYKEVKSLVTLVV